MPTSFREALDAGAYGVTAKLPPAERALGEAPRGVAFVDANAVLWRVTMTGHGLDLDPAHDALLRGDVEDDAIEEFERTFEESAESSGRPADARPRTDDPKWSPVVECERVEVPGGAALQAITRTAYEPGFELVVGTLVVPLVEGSLAIEVTSRANPTGLRESVLFTRRMDDHPGVDPLELFADRSQAAIDAREHDALFPEHPLSRVRAALAWLREAGAGRIRVEAPAKPAAGGELELAEAGCALTLPARYARFTPPHPMSPSLVMFSRVGLPKGMPRLLDVWRLPGPRLRGARRAEQLEQLARETLEDWRNEGVSDLRIALEPLPERDGRAHLASDVELVVDGIVSRSVGRWFVEPDGVVFRISGSALLDVPTAEARAEVDAALGTFRRLDAHGSEGGSVRGGGGKKPWWKLW